MTNDLLRTKKLRTKNFKFGCLHGKMQASDKSSEAQIQRTVFLSQRLKVWRKRDITSIIRIFAYEVPLYNSTRGRCIDLMGYDEEHSLWIFELKKGSSSERLEKVIEQINDYAENVKRIKSDMEREFNETFFFPIEFTAIKKMILAPREFYTGKKSNDRSIDYGYFRNKDINKKEPVGVSLYKLCASRLDDLKDPPSKG